MSRGRAPGPGTLKKRGQQWTLDYTDASGKRVRRALGDTKRVAERRRSELIQRRDMELDGLGAIEGQNLLLSVIAEDYLADMEPRVSAHHFRNVHGRLLKTVGALDGLRVRDLKPMQVIRLRNNAVQAGRSHRTANLIATTLQAMLRWAVESGIVAQSPIEKIKPLPQGPEHRRYRRRAMTDDEIRRLLLASQVDDERAHILALAKGTWRIPQTPMWRLLLDTGARWNELRQVAWQDVDLAQGLVVLRAENTKSRKQRVIPLAGDTLDVLRGLKVLQQQALQRIPRAADRVFLSPEGSEWGRYTTNPMRILDRVLRRAKIQKHAVDGTKLDIHALRHTFATRLARSGAPLMHAQRLLGHSDPKLTAQIYTHLDAEDLRGAIEGMALRDQACQDQRKEATA